MDAKIIRYDRLSDGTIKVTYGDEVCIANDQIEAGKKLAEMMLRDRKENSDD